MPIVIDDVEVVPAGQAQPAGGQGAQTQAGSGPDELKPADVRRAIQVLRLRALRAKAH